MSKGPSQYCLRCMRVTKPKNQVLMKGTDRIICRVCAEMLRNSKVKESREKQ